MKHPLDQKTGELPGVDSAKKPRGRPPLASAKTDAERARDYRARKKARRLALRDTTTLPTSKILDLSGDIARALQDREKKSGQVRQANF